MVRLVLVLLLVTSTSFSVKNLREPLSQSQDVTIVIALLLSAVIRKLLTVTWGDASYRHGNKILACLFNISTQTSDRRRLSIISVQPWGKKCLFTEEWLFPLNPLRSTNQTTNFICELEKEIKSERGERKSSIEFLWIQRRLNNGNTFLSVLPMYDVS